MKRLIVSLIFFSSIFSVENLPYPGEFSISLVAGGEFKLRLESEGYVWLWDKNKVDNNVYYAPMIDLTFDHKQIYRFDTPKNEDVGTDGVMPWGIIKFTITWGNNNSIFTFTIDFRDEECSTEYSYGDIELFFNTELNRAELKAKNINGQSWSTLISTDQNNYTQIWVACHKEGNPVDNRFTAPVYLNNVIKIDESEIVTDGALYIDNQTVNSGAYALVKYKNDYLIGTNNERFTNFQSSGVTYKHNNWNKKTNFNEYLMSRITGIDFGTKNQKAFFLPLHYVKVEAVLETFLIQDKGDFQFQDPWFVLSDGTQPENYWITVNGSYEPTGKVGASEKGVFLNQSGPPLWQPPYYSVETEQIKNINLGGSLGTRTFYFQNWSGTEVQFENASALQTGVVFKDNIPGVDPIVSANYKGHLLSNSSAACANNGQRKVVRDKNGIYHMVYESMGKIWYSKSVTTNYQGEWTPDEKLLDYGPDLIYSNPSLSVNTTTASQPYVYLSIVFEVKEDPNVAEVTGVIKNLTTGTSTYLTAEPIDVNFFGNAKPVIASFADEVFVVYKESSSSFLKYLRYYLNGSGTWTRIAPLDLPSASASAINPTVAANTNPIKSKNPLQIAWQQAPTSIKYQYSENQLSNDPGSQRTFVTKDVSFGSGNTYNSNPSIIALDGDGARIAWYGTRKLSQTEYQYRTVFKNPSTNTFWNFGSNVGLPSINKIDDYTDFILGWSENNGSNSYFADNSLSSITPLNIPGKDLQLCNGSSKSTMYATSFSNNTLPYFFSQSNNIQSLYISKTNAAGINKGREGVVAKGSGEIYFTIGDVNVNGENISFTTLPDSFTVTSVNDINNNVRTIPFAVSENTQFYYSVQYGITDSTEVVNSLSDNDVVSFRVEIVDEATNEVLGVFDNVSFTKQQVVPYENFSYQVSTEGIGNRTVYLRLVTSATEGCYFSLANLLDNQNIIAKRAINQISFKSAAVIKDYALAQNYPNPFNPVTTITYQLPKSGNVTLKIFDILGNEVGTLVDENKEMGRYTVQFDASSLASGMYVYQLRANDYTSSKKMMLVK